MFLYSSVHWNLFIYKLQLDLWIDCECYGLDQYKKNMDLESKDFSHCVGPWGSLACARKNCFHVCYKISGALFFFQSKTLLVSSFLNIKNTRQLYTVVVFGAFQNTHSCVFGKYLNFKGSFVLIANTNSMISCMQTKSLTVYFFRCKHLQRASESVLRWVESNHKGYYSSA